jgi:hypothetical protein
MVKKITNPSDYLGLLDNLDAIFHDQSAAHAVPISREGLATLANVQLLTWTYHCWSNEALDSIFLAHAGFNPLFNKTVFQDVLWLSKSGYGLKLLKTALDFSRQYDIVIMGSVTAQNNKKLEKLYKKLGFREDSTCWIKQQTQKTI